MYIPCTHVYYLILSNRKVKRLSYELHISRVKFNVIYWRFEVVRADRRKEKFMETIRIFFFFANFFVIHITSVFAHIIFWLNGVLRCTELVPFITRKLFVFLTASTSITAVNDRNICGISNDHQC